MKHITLSKKLAVTIVPLAMIIGVAIITVAVVQHLNESKTKAIREPIATTNPVQAVRNLIATKYAKTAKLPNQFGAEVRYTVEGYDFAATVANSVANSANVYPVSTESKARVYDTLLPAVTAQLKTLGYEKTTNGAFNPEISGIGGYKATYFVKGDTVCEWYDNVSYAEFTCVGQSRLKQVAQVAQPLAAGLAQDLQAKSSQVALSMPEIKTNPQNPKYEHAIVRFMGAQKFMYPSKDAGDLSLVQAAAYFYRPVGTANWIYYRYSQQGIGCSDMSGVLAQAFSDICRIGDI